MNNVNKLDRYQLINDVWTHVSYIDYTYDENGNRTSRTNYNSYGGPDFYIGGVYTYLYEDGVRNGWELSMGGNLVEKATLVYNEDGKLLEELVKAGWGNGPFENSWKADYVYNEDGTLKNTLMNHWDAGSWNVVSSDWFEYDEHGNCIEWTHKNGNSVYDRYEYEYDLNYNFDQIVFLYNPEEDIATKTLVEMNNKLMLSHWYTQNDSGVLIYVCDYIYSYNLIGTLGVQNPTSVAGDMLVYPNPASDLITFSAGNMTIKGLDITNTAGQVVLKKTNLNQREMNLDVSSFNPGVYFARILTSKGVVTKKFMVK